MTREILFFKFHSENYAERLVPDLFIYLFVYFKKVLYDVWSIDLQLRFAALNLVYNRNKK